MSAEYYREKIATRNNIEIGIAMGRAIKDNMINPELYAKLCKEAIAVGFKFQFIIFGS